MPLTVWHYEIDTLPRLEPSRDGRDDALDLYVPIGVYPAGPDRVDFTVEFSVDDGPVRRISFDVNEPAGSIQTIDAQHVHGILSANKDDPAPVRARPYLDFLPKLERHTDLLFEGAIRAVPYGSKVQYRAVAALADG